MQQPLVSVIIPIYNSLPFIAPAVAALQEQTYPNMEIIIVDDGSVDGSFEIAKRFESDTLIVVRQVNSGAAIARNNGLKHASGEYVQFLDVDDYLSKDKIEKQVKALEGHADKVAVCDYIEFFEESELQAPKIIDHSAFIHSSDSPADFLINLYGGNGSANFIQTNSWLTPRHLIDKAGGWREFRCPDDDGEFFARVILASKGIVHVPGIFNYYRRSVSESRLSNNSNRKYLQNSLLAIDLKYQYLLQHKNSIALQKAMATQYLRFAVAVFPKHKQLSELAYKKYKLLYTPAIVPKLGGKIVEAIKYTLGWKAARFIRYYLREKNI
ncbi:glycosyltransferase family 2 protein [Pontibacter locisalis]|uniref:Glycosyltransferase family 2 protein n=1 Tax=Pontibacter locisalis TaxID=1719035 RepID=A0ABW5IQQ8_9BACT